MVLRKASAPLTTASKEGRKFAKRVALRRSLQDGLRPPPGGAVLRYNAGMMGRRARWILACVLTCLLAAAPRQAEAHGSLKEALIAIVVGMPAVAFGLTDLGFLIYDITKGAQNQRPSSDAAVAEVVLSSLQLGIGTLLLVSERKEPLVKALVLPDLVLSAGMLAHGVWTLSTQGESLQPQVMTSPLRSLGTQRPAWHPSLSLRPQGLPRGAGLLLQGSF